LSVVSTLCGVAARAQRMEPRLQALSYEYQPQLERKGERVMSSNAIFFGWNQPMVGREQLAAAQFQEFVQYLAGLQKEGAIASFEPVFLTPHGGDLNGFFLIRGENSKLDELVASDPWQTYMTRAGFSLQGAGAVRGAAGDMVNEWMKRWAENIPT
jgi:hypothetical protein